VKLNTRSLVTFFLAASVILCTQFASKADTFHRVAVNGRYHLNSVYATGINVNAYSTTYTATGITVPGGTVMITNDVMTFYTSVKSIKVDTMLILGVPRKHGTVTTGTFIFKGEAAHAVVEVAAYTLYGEVGFQIVRNSDNAILYASWPAGFYTMVPLEYGGISIL
jgi:hypothetical protein